MTGFEHLKKLRDQQQELWDRQLYRAAQRVREGAELTQTAREALAAMLDSLVNETDFYHIPDGTRALVHELVDKRLQLPPLQASDFGLTETDPS